MSLPKKECSTCAWFDLHGCAAPKNTDMGVCRWMEYSRTPCWAAEVRRIMHKSQGTDCHCHLIGKYLHNEAKEET